MARAFARGATAGYRNLLIRGSDTPDLPGAGMDSCGRGGASPAKNVTDAKEKDGSDLTAGHERHQ